MDTYIVSWFENGKPKFIAFSSIDDAFQMALTNHTATCWKTSDLLDIAAQVLKSGTKEDFEEFKLQTGK